ncbi:MAG: CARDB domain-containing protein [Myxococcota bacterium]|nr:CARDB domain-containing protein [Myxococcota bacterium]
MRHRNLIMVASLVLVPATSSCSGGWGPGGGGGGGNTLPASLIGIGVGPQDPTVTLGQEIQFTATGFYDDQSTRNITDSVEWLSSNSQALAVSNSLDLEGLGTTHSSGQSFVQAEFHSLYSNEVRVSVTQASVSELQVSPATVTMHAGQNVQLQAEASFSDGSHGNVSGSVLWLTDNPSIATVTETGEVEGEGIGSTTIRALYQSGNGEFEGQPALITVVDGDVVIDDADLRIVGLNAVSAGNGVTYTVQVKNSGGTPASSFWVDSWLNRTAAPPNPPTSGDGYQMVDLLEPGEITSVAIELNGVGAGTYQSWVMVDSFNHVFEGNLGENNNIWGPEPLQVSGGDGPIGPDLSITYLQAFVQASQGQVLYIIDVTNTGDEPATNFSVGVFANPNFPPVAPATADEQLGVTTLPPGETAYLSMIVRDVPTDYWQSYVLADRTNSVQEHNESNNLAAFQVLP